MNSAIFIQMNKTTTSTKLAYLGAAINEGQCHKGVEKTPQILRESGLFASLKNKYGVQVRDLGDISVQSLNQQVDKQKEVEHHVKNLHLLSPMLEQISNKVYTEVTQNPDSLMLTIGGDHSIATGSISGLMRKYGKSLKVIWVDAHPDFIDIKKSDYYGYHGIPLAHLCGLSKFQNFDHWMKEQLPIENVVLIGIRDIDHDEWKSLKELKVKCFTMDHVDKFGIGDVMKQAIEYLDPTGDSPFHISFDIDAIDPGNAYSTGTLFRGGLTPRESCHIIRRVAHERKLVGLDVVEINEDINQEGVTRNNYRGEEDLQKITPTLGMGIDLIDSLFTQYLTL